MTKTIGFLLLSVFVQCILSCSDSGNYLNLLVSNECELGSTVQVAVLCRGRELGTVIVPYSRKHPNCVSAQFDLPDDFMPAQDSLTFAVVSEDISQTVPGSWQLATSIAVTYRAARGKSESSASIESDCRDGAVLSLRKNNGIQRMQ